VIVFCFSRLYCDSAPLCAAFMCVLFKYSLRLSKNIAKNTRRTPLSPRDDVVTCVDDMRYDDGKGRKLAPPAACQEMVWFGPSAVLFYRVVVVHITRIDLLVCMVFMVPLSNRRHRTLHTVCREREMDVCQSFVSLCFLSCPCIFACLLWFWVPVGRVVVVWYGVCAVLWLCAVCVSRPTYTDFPTTSTIAAFDTLPRILSRWFHNVATANVHSGDSDFDRLPPSCDR
jgi:hypothetical protein